LRAVRSRVAVGALVLLGGIVLSPSIARADLVVIQESNGFPGGGHVEEARQKVFLGADRLRVLDEEHGWALFVLRDKKVVREASALDRTFVEKPFTDYQKIREGREATRAGQVEEYHKAVEKAKNDAERLELKKTIESMGLREDGKTLARTERFDEARTYQVVVDGVRKDLRAQHVVVRENEGPPIFDLWVVAGLAPPESLFKFYQEIGTFSAPVIDEVLKVGGFPVEISATVDDGNNRRTFHTKVVEIREEKIDAVDFDVPAEWKQVAAQAQNAPNIQATKCEICGKAIRPGSGDGSFLWRDPFHRTPHPVCSDECRKELIRRLARK
jgi:hypothetical protein